jgi:exodeoxyribonuclease VII large subunit
MAEDQSQLGFSFVAQPVIRKVWTPRELVGALRTSIEQGFRDVWLQGEVSNFRPADSGHLYFTIKDDTAQLRVVMFRLKAQLLRFRPENGMQVVARGRVSLYEQRGELQLMAEYLEPQGAGALQVAFEQLKAKLAAEGLFDQGRKKPLPVLPRRIGVVTSPRGAAIQDILNILRRRHESVGVLIYPAQVQGDAAPSEVAAGIKFFNRARGKDMAVEVIIVARGGGSLEDLAAFNHEGLARVIAESEVPVISAVGHETDFTIADFVADLRAPTPSAAAEIVIQSKQSLDEQVTNLRQRLGRAARYRILMAQKMLSEMAQHQVFARMSDAIARRQQRTDDLTYRLAGGYERSLRVARQRVDVASARLRHFDLRRVFTGLRREIDARQQALGAAARHFLGQRRARLEQSGASLEQLSPLKVLERGYALVFDGNGALLKDPAQVSDGDPITARLARGVLPAVAKKK